MPNGLRDKACISQIHKEVHSHTHTQTHRYELCRLAAETLDRLSLSSYANRPAPTLPD